MSEQNKELQLAADFIRETNQSLYLTGKAGTGKTTFLHQLRKHPPKRLIITAPTGVAAMNAKGVTLHSFFQLPFSPFLPTAEGTEQLRHHQVSREKRNIIKSLDLLIIDEISMVRADTLDAIDTILRRYRRTQAPFGGVQLLMIGDLHQLPPVVKPDTSALLAGHYETHYFFSSHALKKTHWVTIELKYIYRQSDAHFINLLNQVRDNALDHAGLTALNQRHHPSHVDTQAMITLTSHNASAERINQKQLQQLDAPAVSLNADVTGDFPEHMYPTEKKLVLKRGAQVMFLRNDNSAEKRYFNGKLGTIVSISEVEIRVRCDNEPPIRVERVTWENQKYGINSNTQAIEAQVIGSFVQFPLKLAWAITIHKSQGLTFNKVAIDAGDAFSHGQVYVALSRCRSLQGIVLTSPIPNSAIKTDHQVREFVDDARENAPTQVQLDQSKVQYQQTLLLDCFNFNALKYHLSRLTQLIDRNQKAILFSASEQPTVIMNNMLTKISRVSDRFQQQLANQFNATQIPTENDYIQTRVKDSHKYFKSELHQLAQWLESIGFDSDNKEIKREYTQHLDYLHQSLHLKIAAINTCQTGFHPKRYLSAIATAQIERQKPRVNNRVDVEYNINDLKYPNLMKQLSQWRRKQADEQNVEAYKIVHQRILFQIATLLPYSQDQLKRIKGIGPKTLEKYGAQLLKVVADFCQENHIEQPGVA